MLSCTLYPDPTLTVTNVCEALKDVTDWFTLGHCLPVKKAKLEEIKRNFEDLHQCLQELIENWIQTHRLPCWQIIIKVLDKMSHLAISGKVNSAPPYGAIAARVKSVYVTGR